MSVSDFTHLFQFLADDFKSYLTMERKSKIYQKQKTPSFLADLGCHTFVICH